MIPVKAPDFRRCPVQPAELKYDVYSIAPDRVPLQVVACWYVPLRVIRTIVKIVAPRIVEIGWPALVREVRTSWLPVKAP